MCFGGWFILGGCFGVYVDLGVCWLLLACLGLIRLLVFGCGGGGVWVLVLLFWLVWLFELLCLLFIAVIVLACFVVYCLIDSWACAVTVCFGCLLLLG